MKDSLMWILFFVCVMEISGGLILKNICPYIVFSKRRLFYLFVHKDFAFFVIERLQQLVAIELVHRYCF